MTISTLTTREPAMHLKIIFRQTFLLGALLGMVATARASSIIPLSTGQLIAASGAILRGTVVGQSCGRDADGLIVTRTSLRVTESLKGKLPLVVRVAHRGGAIGTENEFCGLSPNFLAGAEYLVFVHRRPDGQLEGVQGSASAVHLVPATGGSTGFASPGGDLLAEVRKLTDNGALPGEDVTDQVGSIISEAATGMLGGIAARFLQPDRGEPIPYQIDATSLPAGITLTQATNAVQQALNAWTAVTSLKFKLESIQSFGQGADTIPDNTGKLWLQLHDDYARINSAGILGIGGRNASSSPVAGPGWDLGGNIAGNEFRKSTIGYVVLEATNTAMQTLATFTEVLCHEIGHALSLAHSSENPSEPSTILKQAIMYYTAHADGRGAALGAYDPPVIQQAYPSNNTAPFTFSRVIDAVTQPVGAPNVPGINEIEMRGYDLQTASLTMDTNGFQTVGTGDFSRSGNLIKYTPNNFWVTSRADPASTGFYDRLCVRFSDGTNASGYSTVRVISHSGDQYPAVGSDGIPDDWMTTYFGNPDPAAGANRGANADYDGDKLSNLNEYRAGMDPTSTNSAQRITVLNATNIQWQAKAYELYELLGSTNLTTWTRVGNPIQPTTSIGSASISFTNPTRQFFRILKVP